MQNLQMGHGTLQYQHAKVRENIYYLFIPAVENYECRKTVSSKGHVGPTKYHVGTPRTSSEYGVKYGTSLKLKVFWVKIVNECICTPEFKQANYL